MLKYKYMFLELVTSLFERSISKGQLCGCWIDGKIPLQKKAVRVLRAVCNGPHLSSRRSASFVLLFPIFYIRLWMHVLSTVHDAFSTRTRGKGYLGFRNAIRGIVVVCIVYLAVVEDFVCHRGKWLVFANCFLVDSWCWRETDDEVFEQSRNWEIHRIRVSLFVFSILAGDRRKVKGFPTRLSVKIRDRIVGVFDTERTGGKTLKGKKKRKNAVEAWRVHENVRDRGEERLDEGARSKGSWKGNVNLWDHVDRSHASVSLAFFVYYPPLAFYLRLPVTPSYELVRSIDYF